MKPGRWVYDSLGRHWEKESEWLGRAVTYKGDYQRWCAKCRWYHKIDGPYCAHQDAWIAWHNSDMGGNDMIEPEWVEWYESGKPKPAYVEFGHRCPSCGKMIQTSGRPMECLSCTMTREGMS